MKTRLLTLVSIIFLLNSCNTYTVPVESFKSQMTESNSGQLKTVEINHPTFYSKSNSNRNLNYQANTIKLIEVFDKKGNKVKLENSPKLEMRITKKDGKKNVLLFDTVIVQNDTLKGARSRLIQNLTREIALIDIEKIEIQDSGKVYKYQ